MKRKHWYAILTLAALVFVAASRPIPAPMAQTAKSSSDLYAQLADNNYGAISPEEVRDVVASNLPLYAMMDTDTAAETTIAAADTPVKAAGTTTDEGSSDVFTVATTNRVTYTGTPDIVCQIVVNAECTVAGNGKIVGITIAKNGTAVTSIARKVATGTDVGAFGNNWIFELSTNDYVEVWVENNTDDTNMTLNDFHMSVFGRVQ